MRLFTGLDVPYEMRRNLELLLQLLKPAADINWSPLANLHVTTKFIGEWPADRLNELSSALTNVPRPGELKIMIRGLGWHPNPHAPRTLFAAIAAPQGLLELAAATETALEALGIAAERRAFRPHLTLARIKGSPQLFDLKRTIAELPTVEFGTYTSTEFHLYSSLLRPEGSTYTKLASFPLAK